jgi:hypothetical protein
MAEKRYTLTLPSNLYGETREAAENRGQTIKEFITQAVKLTLVALKADEEGKEVIFKDDNTESRLIL